VIVLTDKHLAEALFTQLPFDQSRARLKRGALVTSPQELANLQARDRYDPTVSRGVSKRWLPGSEAATFCAQGDEHDGAGSSVEDAENARCQTEKRMKKMEAVKAVLPEPPYTGPEDPEVLVVSWGSNRGVIEDVLRDTEIQKFRIGFLHYQFLWPLRTERFEALSRVARRTVIVECNHEGQFADLLGRACGSSMMRRMLKFDGRPFSFDELRDSLLSALRS
jgi:2-oxoglutarate ferredoxin oxidoreductase subunit alpha